MATVKVTSSGTAPKNTKVGDTVTTQGGNYKVVAANTPGASYNPASGLYSIKESANPTPASSLAAAITASPTIASNTTTTNADNITKMYDEQRNSELAALKAAIQKGISEQQTTIANAPATYQPLKNASEVNRYSDLRSVLEQSANAGDRGGVGRQAALDTQTAADNRLNNLNLQQQNVVDTANTAINDLKNSQSTSAAQITSDTAAAKLAALIAQSNTDAATKASNTATAKTDYANTVSAYSNDYQAEINKIQALIDAGNIYDTDGVSLAYKKSVLQAARADKVATQKEEAAAAAQQALENQQAAEKLQLQEEQTKYNLGKPYYNPKSSSSKTSALTYKQAVALYNAGDRSAAVLKVLGK